MLNDITVVESAISAFNNAALVGPAFLWWSVLMIPLFFMVRLYGNDFIARIGWKTDDLLPKVSVWTVIFVLLWVVLFGGNYAVLRDELSVLPMVTAVILFLSALFVSSHMRKMPLPHMGWRQWLCVLAMIMLIASSDMHAWWGAVLQIAAFVLGVVFGRFAGSEMRPMGGCVLIMMTTVFAVLMQPEFFRFGQLGNLTIFHLLAVLVFGITAVAAVVASNVKACDRINNSLFIKLKWLFRVIALLAISLFLLTEAVPVFIGALAMSAIVFALSVYHAKSSLFDLGNKLFAVCLFSFGVITVMPVISALGLIFWMNTKNVNFWHEIKVLL